MRAICWNCQGLGTPLTVQNLRAMVAQERPNLILLMETKNKKSVVDRIKRTLNFQNSHVEEPKGIAGGMAVFWNTEMEVEVEFSSQEMINMICSDYESNIKMRLSCIHAPNIYGERQQLWEKLRQLASSNTLPWVCMGDFNEILYYWEKRGRRMADKSRMQAFQNCINDCSLMEIDCKGCAFTWSNNREGDHLVQEKLDRVFCSMDWRVMLPEAEAFALPAVGSDHSPLLVVSSTRPVKKQKEFNFEAFWAEDSECKEIVKHAWQSQSCTQGGLGDKLRITSKALITWSKKKFPNNNVRIIALKKELQSITNSHRSCQDKSRIKRIKEEMETLWRREEMFWGLKTWINWLR